MLWRIRTCAQITSYSKITSFDKMEPFGIRQIVRRVGLFQHIHGTTQSQSVFCLNHMSGQFKLISVLLYSLIWITSLGNCQTWEGCTERVIMDNCFKTSTDRQWRCFCLHEYPSAKWHAAHSACASTYHNYQGALATDDSPYIHDILQRLCEYTRQEEAWIGARTRPLYWNWMATKENKFARPISYQGCYNVPSGVDEENHKISESNLRSQCHTFCAAKNYSYFALEKEERWFPRWVYLWFCSCGHYFNSDTVDQSCEKCDTSSEDHGWCGYKGESKAVYSIHAMGLFNKWGGDEPKGVHDVHCLRYDTYAKEWKSQPCHYFLNDQLCVREKDGPDCNEYEYVGQLSGKCFRVQQGARVTQKTAADACQNRGMSLVSASNYSIHEDALDIWMQAGKWFLSFWTSGTTLRWVWITEEEVGVNGQNVGWADKEEFAFENMCLALNSSGIWSSQWCFEYKAYICKTVVDDEEVIPRPTSTLSAVITESSRPAVQETTASARDTTAATRETTVSTREIKASTQETETTDSQGGQGSDGGRQVALTAGATVAGIFCLLVLFAFTIFFIRRKRNVQKTTSEQPSTFVHNHFPLNNLRSNGAVPSNVATKGKEATTSQPKETDVHAYDSIHAESQAHVCQQDIDLVTESSGDYSELNQTRPSHDYVALKIKSNKEGEINQTAEYVQLDGDRIQHEYAALSAPQKQLNLDKIQTEYGGLHANRNSLYQK